jgi:hypothetical protein
MQTEGNLETANTINGYYVQKVLRIRAGRGVQNTSQMTSTTSRDGDRREKNTFAFGFSSPGPIANIFSGLKSTSALGTDGIPVSVLKMVSDMLARPVSHLVNMSLLAGVFPSAFKTALIHPVYKGGGKARSNPGSYRPVAILCAVSKVLETVAKEDLEAHMKKHDILPTSQQGFRKGRSCTTALAAAAWKWLTYGKVGKIAHCLPVVVKPRLPGSKAATSEALSQLQVAVNDVARSVVGCRREVHVTTVDLLEVAKYLLLNQQAVKATAMSAVSAYHSCDGANGIQNPVGEAMFSGAEIPLRSLRSARASEVRVRTRGLDTHITHGLEAWNACRELRDSRTKAEAYRAATQLARDSPL